MDAHMEVGRDLPGRSSTLPLEKLCNSSSRASWASSAVLSPIPKGFLHDGESLVCLGTVISLSCSFVIEEKA
jgi:hypothetical protein